LRTRAVISGVVQGVGFRPYLYRLAREHGLAGEVSNNGQGVNLELEGPAGRVEDFFRELIPRKPPLAHILRVEKEEIPELGKADFRILPSSSGAAPTALVPPDTALCEDCLAELQDPADRRYLYPFINCTNCGPRYTIIRGLPYDRPLTTMAGFAMCPDCRAEYEDPADRRFHAQPNACPVCGPRAWLAEPGGRELPGDGPTLAGERLARGAVVAVKGLGGFHLACDAADQEAVARLRRRKRREEKPLAVMVPDLDSARALVRLSKAEEELLLSPVRPIILAPMRADHGLAPEVAPGLDRLGVMLAYTPLHHVLLTRGPEALVMTSGNLSDEPIARTNQEALEKLAGVADFFLLHDREIHTRADDSVVASAGGQPRLIRRSRGYVPRPVFLEREGPEILALGPELKNTVCLTRGREAFLSAHVGDLKDAETLDFFRHTIDRLQDLVGVRPDFLACDLHPDYLSTRQALETPGPDPIRVQHHAAHILSAMAEQGLSGPVLGLALDGTGLGLDGTVWGGEILLVSERGLRRLGRIRPFPLPGGDAAAREGWRTACGLLRSAFGPDWAAHRPAGLVRRMEEQGFGAGRLRDLERMMERGLNSPLCSSAGRLFDGVAALAGVRFVSAYEGQAAVELEGALDPGENQAYPLGLETGPGGEGGSDIIEIDPRPMLNRLLEDLGKGLGPRPVSARFHAGLIKVLARAAGLAGRWTGCGRVVLSGGCFVNQRLAGELPRLLKRAGLQVFGQRDVPTNDGGLSLGQALGARLALAAEDPGLWTRESG
jgi:hydrogenase maturation protein HypF